MPGREISGRKRQEENAGREMSWRERQEENAGRKTPAGKLQAAKQKIQPGNLETENGKYSTAVTLKSLNKYNIKTIKK